MICINGYCDGTDGCHGISQSLLVSFGYEPVVFDMGNCKPAIVVTGLSILLKEIKSLKLMAGWMRSNELNKRRQSQQVKPHHWGVWVCVCRLQAVADHVVVGVGHPGTTAAIGTVRFGAVHQVLFTQRFKTTCLLVYLSLNSSCGAEGPAWATVSLWGTFKTCSRLEGVHDSVWIE